MANNRKADYDLSKVVPDAIEQKREQRLSLVLADFVAQQGKEALLKHDMIYTHLENSLIPERDRIQLLLILSTPGIDLWLCGASESMALTWNRLLQSTQSHTGLRRSVILHHLSSIAMAIDKNALALPDTYLNDYDVDKGFVVPYSYYAAELSLFHDKVENKVNLSNSEVEYLNKLCNMGIGEAMFIASQFLKELTPAKAAEFAVAAAEEGSLQAHFSLGQIAFERGDFQEAFQHYTTYGGVALPDSSQNHMRQLLQIRNNNLKSTTFFVFSTITMFILAVVIGLAMQPSHLVPSLVFLSILSLIILIGAKLRVKRRAFSSLGYFPLTLFVTWASVIFFWLWGG